MAHFAVSVSLSKHALFVLFIFDYRFASEYRELRIELAVLFIFVIAFICSAWLCLFVFELIEKVIERIKLLLALHVYVTAESSLIWCHCMLGFLEQALLESGGVDRDRRGPMKVTGELWCNSKHIIC